MVSHTESCQQYGENCDPLIYSVPIGYQNGMFLYQVDALPESTSWALVPITASVIHRRVFSGSVAGPWSWIKVRDTDMITAGRNLANKKGQMAMQLMFLHVACDIVVSRIP